MNTENFITYGKNILIREFLFSWQPAIFAACEQLSGQQLCAKEPLLLINNFH